MVCLATKEFCVVGHARASFYPPFVRTMSIGSGSKEANDRNAEQKMTFVDDTKEFRDCSTVLHSKRVDFEHGVISAVFPSHTCNYIVLFW